VWQTRQLGSGRQSPLSHMLQGPHSLPARWQHSGAACPGLPAASPASCCSSPAALTSRRTTAFASLGFVNTAGKRTPVVADWSGSGGVAAT
jgi:hypothetical protein